MNRQAGIFWIQYLQLQFKIQSIECKELQYKWHVLQKHQKQIISSFLWKPWCFIYAEAKLIFCKAKNSFFHKFEHFLFFFLCLEQNSIVIKLTSGQQQLVWQICVAYLEWVIIQPD